MPLVSPPSGLGKTLHIPAVTVTAGATAHTMGSWQTLQDPLSYDVYGLGILARNVAQSSTNTCMLMDIGVASSGGGNERIVIPYLDVGAAATQDGKIGVGWVFPVYLRAGMALRARAQGVIASDTVDVMCHLYGVPPWGTAEDAPQEWTQYGAVPGSSCGTAITSGAAAWGSSVAITSSTSRLHHWWHVGIDWGTNTVVSAGFYLVRLTTDSAGTELIGIWRFMATTVEDIVGPFPQYPITYRLPAGKAVYAAANGPAAVAMSVIVYAY